MPGTYKRSPGSRSYHDYDSTDVEAALLEVDRGTLSYRQASATYGIPRATLNDLIKNPTAKSHKGQPIFSKEEEAEFVNVIQVCGSFGQPLTRLDVRMVAKGMLEETNRKVEKLTNNMPGESWIEGFLKRHDKEINLRTAQNIKRSRAQKTTKEMETYFENLKVTFEDVPPSNIINYDETNVSDDPGRQKAIFKRGVKYPELIRNFTKGAISIMLSGTVSGHLLPTYVVFKADNLWSSWCEGGPKGTRYNRTKSGRFDSDTFSDWFQTVIVPYCRKFTGPKVLIGHNLFSHFNQVVLKICKEMDIRFVMLPDNSTHIAQPFDVVYFSPVKRKWRKILGDFKTDYPNLPSLSKDMFPGLLKRLLEGIKLSSAANLKAGFEKCGIYPFNPSAVLQRLPNPRQKAAETVSAAVLEYLQKTRAPKERERKRRKKINVAAGKSVSLEDITAEPSTGADENARSRALDKNPSKGKGQGKNEKGKRKLMDGKAGKGHHGRVLRKSLRHD